MGKRELKSISLNEKEANQLEEILKTTPYKIIDIFRIGMEQINKIKKEE